jgi:hypothetical protein
MNDAPYTHDYFLEKSKEVSVNFVDDLFWSSIDIVKTFVFPGLDMLLSLHNRLTILKQQKLKKIKHPCRHTKTVAM